MDLTFSHFDFTENLKPQRELFKDCFPETKGEAIQQNEHYMWKFHSFPHISKSWEYASYMGQEIVGYYAAIPYRYKIDKKITNVGMVCDVMTSSAQRGKGIFTKMGAYSTGELSKEVPFTIGYPIRKEVIPGHLKVGWKIPFSLPLYMKFFKTNSLLSSKKLGLIAPIANAFLNVYNVFCFSSFNKTYKFSINADVKDVSGYETFVKEWIESQPIALIKDLPFAIWRYSAPERKYRFISVENTDGKMIAFVAFRNIIKEEVPSFGILDYMVLPGYEDCHGLINRIFTNLAKDEHIEAIMTMMSKTSASKYQLLRNGFLKSPFVFSLIIKNLTNEFSNVELFDESKWHLMWVDSDDL